MSTNTRYKAQETAYIVGATGAPATLTATYTDNDATFRVRGFSQAVFYVQYTPAAGQTNRFITIKYDFGDITTNTGYQYVSKNSSTTLRKEYITPTKFIGATGGTVYKLRDNIDLADVWMTVSVKENGAADFGTISIIRVLSS